MARRATVVLATLLLASSARADDTVEEKRRCAHASEHAQELRKAGRLRAARAELVSCVRDTCPTVVRTDCGGWLEEVERLQPTVVLGMRDAAGRDLVDVTVRVDGDVLTERLQGQAIEIDPGEHAFRFEPNGGQSIEVRAVIREGEKGRSVVAVVPAPPTPRSRAREAAPSGARTAATIVLGGFGILAIGAGVFLEVKGSTEIDDLRARCAPTCDPSEVNAARAKLLSGDIAIATGALALGAAAVLFLTRPRSAPGGATGVSRGLGGSMVVSRTAPSNVPSAPFPLQCSTQIGAVKTCNRVPEAATPGAAPGRATSPAQER